MSGFPRIVAVETADPRLLLVRFENGAKRVYDCAPLMDLVPFRALRHAGFFRSVRVDPGGYGVSWDEETDLSEAEIWTRGRDWDREDREPHDAGTLVPKRLKK